MVARELNKSIFLDSDACIALFNLSDPNSALARKLSMKLKTHGNSIITGTNILLEVSTLLSQRISHGKSIEFLTNIRSGEIAIIHPSEKLLLEAENLFKNQTSKNVSYSDCVSFAIMKDNNIQIAFSFDSDFKKNGFILLKERYNN